VSTEGPGPRRSVDRAAVAVFVVFALNGFFFAEWAARLPAIRDALDTSNALGAAALGLAPWAPLAVVAIVLWGFGAALGFPVGMSAAFDEPEHSAARVSVVPCIGYVAFLAGPPLLGMLAYHVGYRHALLTIAVPLLLSLLLAPVAPPLRSRGTAEVP